MIGVNWYLRNVGEKIFLLKHLVGKEKVPTFALAFGKRPSAEEQELNRRQLIKRVEKQKKSLEICIIQKKRCNFAKHFGNEVVKSFQPRVKKRSLKELQ